MARHLFRHAIAAGTVLAICAGANAGALAAPAHAHKSAHHAHPHHRYHPHILQRADRAADSGDRHLSHHDTAKHATFGAPVFETPVIPPPYPYDGKLAGDGFLGTGILDSNVMRAYGLVRY